MYRMDVVVRAMLPMGVVSYLIHHEMRGSAETLPLFLLPIGLACLFGRGLVGRFDARLRELLAALALSGAVVGSLVGDASLLLWTLFIGSAGLFLLPLFDRAMRSDPEVAVPMPQARNVALALVGLFCLIGASFGEGWQTTLMIAASWGTMLYLPVMFVALALVAGGKTQAGVWAGSVASLVLVLFLVALAVVGIPAYRF